MPTLPAGARLRRSEPEIEPLCRVCLPDIASKWVRIRGASGGFLVVWIGRQQYLCSDRAVHGHQLTGRPL